MIVEDFSCEVHFLIFFIRFDEVLCTAATTINKSERYQNIINYMSGQLCYLMANILYRKAKWEESSWQDITQLISPLLLLCTSKDFTLASADLKRSESSRFLNQCALLSTYRKYQASKSFYLFKVVNLEISLSVSDIIVLVNSAI